MTPKQQQGTLRIGSTNIVQLGKLRDVLNDEYPGPLTVVATATLYDADDNPVLGAVDMTLEHKPDTTGEYAIYFAALPPTLPLVKGQYVLQAIATVGGNVVRRWTVVCWALD